MPYGLLADVNGDKCPKILLALIVGFVTTVLLIIAVCFALFHKVDSVAVELIAIGYGAALGLLGVPTKQRIGRIDNEQNS